MSTPVGAHTVYAIDDNRMFPCYIMRSFCFLKDTSCITRLFIYLSTNALNTDEPNKSIIHHVNAILSDEIV